jgi:hypothetical protein
MFELLVAAGLAVFAVNVWAVIVILVRRRSSSRMRFAYLAALVAAAVAAAWTTFHYDYFSNENTRICGWPVPVVIFQRENPDSHWDDFVGPMTILGYPINVAIFMLIPSGVFLACSYCSSRRDDKREIAAQPR